jgi:uncharacterized repeat protein (TIGR01451 family)
MLIPSTFDAKQRIMRSLALAAFAFTFGAQLKGQYVVPDPALAAQLEIAVPAAMNGNVLDTLHPSLTTVYGLIMNGDGLTDLSGLQYFTNLITLYAAGNPITDGVEHLPPSLAALYLSNCGIDTLPYLPNIVMLQCMGNDLTSLPQLPNTLQELWCDANPLTALPALPGSLRTLYCGACGLSTLPPLPAGLEILGCSSNQLTSLPTLPPALERLYCNDNLLAALPTLPFGLFYLFCDDNLLTQLPALPSSLRRIDCQVNQLSSLPALPDSLYQLTCFLNPLTALPPLPSLYFWKLTCGNSLLTTLPALPGSLQSLNCTNTLLQCVPVLPNSLQELDLAGSNVTCLPNIPLSFNPGISMLGFPITLCNVNTAPCPIQQAAFTGHLFHDDDGDGIRDPGEPPFPMGVARALPGNDLTGPAPDGSYVLPVDSGAHIVGGRPLLYCVNTTSDDTVTLAPMQVDSLRDIGYQKIPGVYDLTVDVMGDLPRQGLPALSWITVHNVGTEPTSATVTFAPDPAVQWVAADEPPTSVVGNVAEWSVQLAPWQTWSTKVSYHTPYTVPAATILHHTLSATPALADTTPANNTMVQDAWVVHSCDPNDKTVTPSTLTPAQGEAGDTLEYVLRFQNVGTAAALRVVITDTLSAMLDHGSIQLVNRSHDCSWYLHQGVLHVIFDPIFLPDSVTDEAGSHGAVKFTLATAQGLIPGTVIGNQANIYFDFNEPVITNTAECIVQDDVGITEATTGAPLIWPNPAMDLVMVSMGRGGGTIEVFDLSGRCVHRQDLKGTLGSMDVRSLPPGNYVLRVMSAYGSRCMRLSKL